MVISHSILQVINYWEVRSITISKLLKTYEFRRGDGEFEKGEIQLTSISSDSNKKREHFREIF